MVRKYEDLLTQTVAANLRHKREELGLTQEQMAVRLQLDINTVRNWENCRRRPDFGQLSHINSCLGIEDWNWLFVREQTQERSPSMSRKPLPSEAEVVAVVKKAIRESFPGLKFDGGEDLMKFYPQAQAVNNLLVAAHSQIPHLLAS